MDDLKQDDTHNDSAIVSNIWAVEDSIASTTQKLMTATESNAANELTIWIVREIFNTYNLPNPYKLTRINVGFTNQTYSVDDTYMIKVCGDQENEQAFAQEAFLYGMFSDHLPVPRPIVYDTTKRWWDRSFMIYPKIHGQNLYARWHTMDNEARKDIIRQLCDILRTINNSSFEAFVNHFQLPRSIDWSTKILDSIAASIDTIRAKGLLSEELIENIEAFVVKNKNALEEQKIALVYWDAHFDNILVENDVIVWLLDFERTEIASIDFVLDIIKRMMEFPKKYMSEESEPFAKHEDYSQLLDWFREFYPELFDFEDMSARLDLYDIEHVLRDIIGWPEAMELREVIAKIVWYKS